MEDAADRALPEMLIDKEPGYDGWPFEKVSATMRGVDSREVATFEHNEAMERLRERRELRPGATAEQESCESSGPRRPSTTWEPS